MNDDDLRRSLESLADRGEPRGPDAVLAAARRQSAAAARRQRPLYVAAALAAAALAVLGTTAVVVHDDEGSRFTGAAATSIQEEKAVLARLTGEQRASRLQRYSSCDALVDSSREKAQEIVSAFGWPGGVVHNLSGEAVVTGRTARRSGASATTTTVAGGFAVDESAEGVATGSSTPPRRASDTNVQEAGVDEPDIVETDGRRLFTLVDNRLRYATVEGGAAHIQGDITLDGSTDMVLAGDRMVVFGYRNRRHPQGRRSSDTVVTIVDVRTPQMKIVSSLVFEGRRVSARVVDGVVRAVVASDPSARLRFEYPTDQSGSATAAALDRNREIVAEAPRTTWLPTLRIEDGDGRIRATRPLVDCDGAYHPQQFEDLGLLTVLTFDPEDPEGVSSTAVQGAGNTVYASRDTLYVASGGPEEDTLVHAFDIKGRTTARYVASGRVKGRTLNQFAFSEHDGHLRVASTAASESFVTVLRNNGVALEQVGQVGGLGPGETIHAVRFMGPVAYVVTFRQTDPLYVVDLADPKAPRVLGELKIPGFSSYLHPIDPGLLLGLGQDATEFGEVQGLQVSVFDVSDPAKPTRLLHKTFAPGSGSLAEQDHHGFLWWAPTQLAVVPIQTVDYVTGHMSAAAVGISARRDALDEVGRIEHPGSVEILRAVVVDDTLFTVSHAGILAAEVRTLAAGNWTPYPAATQ